MSNSNIPSPFIPQCYFQNFNSTKFDVLLSLLTLRDLKNLNSSNHQSEHQPTTDSSVLSPRNCFIIAAYSAIIIISLFGNCLVLNIVIRNSRLRTATYIFFANLALSDLMMTALNVPFNVARLILPDWPFGSVMCSIVPFAQSTSVYVSTFSMTYISFDRYKVICRPLKPKLRSSQAFIVTICIWFLALSLSVPYAIYNRIIPIFTFKIVNRCQTLFPETYSPWIELISLMIQYLLPLTITGILCGKIVCHIWQRSPFDNFTKEQIIVQEKMKRRAVKMIIIVVLLFAICWLPLNTFYMLKEFAGMEFMCESSKSTTIHSTIYFFCHWLAMSSVCYNPFVYCWLNEHFRNKILNCTLVLCKLGLRLFTCVRSITRLNPTSKFDDMNKDELNQGDSVVKCSESNPPLTENDRNMTVMNAYESMQTLVSSTPRSSIEMSVQCKSLPGLVEEGIHI